MEISISGLAVRIRSFSVEHGAAHELPQISLDAIERPQGDPSGCELGCDAVDRGAIHVELPELPLDELTEMYTGGIPHRKHFYAVEKVTDRLAPPA